MSLATTPPIVRPEPTFGSIDVQRYPGTPQKEAAEKILRLIETAQLATGSAGAALSNLYPQLITKELGSTEPALDDFIICTSPTESATTSTSIGTHVFTEKPLATITEPKRFTLADALHLEEIIYSNLRRKMDEAAEAEAGYWRSIEGEEPEE